LPHLRAAAVLFADVQADGMRHQIEAEIKKEDKANEMPSSDEEGGTTLVVTEGEKTRKISPSVSLTFDSSLIRGN